MKQDVVDLEVKNNIAYVYMREYEAKNTFTTRLICGIREAFDKINVDEEVKVVIVQGYDTYFCCGGTRESLSALYMGIRNNEAVKFTDGHFFDVFLQCKVPVIAAVNGHAIGGGFAYTLFADVLIFSENSICSGNYMRYGFTPGMGATYIVPYKMGKLLGWEMLYTANNYFGFELKKRGAKVIVKKKDEVLTTAESIAEEIAKKPRKSIIEFKNFMVQKIREDLPEVIKKEVMIHELTFSQPEVYENIKKNYIEG